MMLELCGIDSDLERHNFLDLLRPGDRIFWETHVGPLLDMKGTVREIAVELNPASGPVPALLNARNSRPGDPDSLIDIAVFPARDRRAYERELLAARRRAEASEENARDLATTLQASLIPPSLPQITGVDLGATYRPAGSGADVGGDFYDFFRVSDSNWIVALGDVCGKGPQAAAITALVRYTIRGAAMETTDLPEILRGVNHALLLDRATETCTAAIARFSSHPEDFKVTMSNAGHPLPLLLTVEGEVRAIGEHAPLLGAFPKARHVSSTFELGKGEALVFFTDGVTEARRQDDFFGEERLHELIERLRGFEAQSMANAIADEVAEFQDGPSRDDVAIVVLRRPAA